MTTSDILSFCCFNTAQTFTCSHQEIHCISILVNSRSRRATDQLRYLNIFIFQSFGVIEHFNTFESEKSDDFTWTCSPCCITKLTNALMCGKSEYFNFFITCSSYECFILRANRISVSYINRDKQGYLVGRLKSSFRKFYGRYGDLIQQYEVSLSRMLNGILTVALANYSDFPTDQTFNQYHDLNTELDIHRTTISFYGAFATGVGCQQGTLTPPCTWSCPIWDVQMFFCWNHWYSIIHYTTNSWLFTWFDFLPNLTPVLDLTTPFRVPL